MANGIGNIFEEIGESAQNLVLAIRYILAGQISIENTLIQIGKTGVGSMFIVAITAIFIGFAISTQLARELSLRFGAENLVGGIVGMGVIRELAPVLTSIVVAGRVGAAVSAEIGSMKTSEQIDALRVLGIDPVQYLIVPKLLSSAVMTPLLTGLSAFLSITSGMIITKEIVHLNYHEYLASVRLFVIPTDVYVMLIKSVVFGIGVSVLATTTGLQVEGGAEAVGNAATKTVVRSIIFIFTFNYLMTSIFFGG